MSTVNERVRQVRQAYGLSMKDFGAKLKISSAAVSNIENAVTNPSEQTIDAICSKFGTSEQWLLCGEGEMFPNKSVEDEVMEFVKDIIRDDDSTRLRFVVALSRIPPEQWKLIADFWRDFSEQ